MKSEKMYLVVGNGQNKETGEKYTRAYSINEVRGTEFQYLNMKDVLYLDGILPVGHIFKVQSSIV